MTGPPARGTDQFVTLDFLYLWSSARPNKNNTECTGNEISLALDVAGVAAGFLPGGGLVSGSASAATAAFATQVGVTAASGVNSIAYKSGPGMVASILGGQALLTSKTAEMLAVDIGKAIPLIGVGVNAISAVYDGYNAYTTCGGGHS